MKFINWNGYIVRADGSILNKDGSLKTTKVNPKNYHFTNFYYEGRLRCHVIQRVVWMAFNGNIPEGLEIDHINNDRGDNRLCNLQMLSKSDNNQKSYDSGNRLRKFHGTPSWMNKPLCTPATAQR